MVNYHKEVNIIRRKSFPEIKGIICIFKIPYKIPGAVVLQLFPRINLIAFSTKCKMLPKPAFNGMIAHELSHISLNQNEKRKNFKKWLSELTDEERINMEKSTDLLAIRKGYGKELIETKKEAKRFLTGTKWEHYLDNYLTENDLKKKLDNQ